MIEISVNFELDSIAVTGTFVRLFHDVYRMPLSGRFQRSICGEMSSGTLLPRMRE